MPKESLAKSLLRRVKEHALCAGEGRFGGLFSGVWWKNGEGLAMRQRGVEGMMWILEIERDFVEFLSSKIYPVPLSPYSLSIFTSTTKFFKIPKRAELLKKRLT